MPRNGILAEEHRLSCRDHEEVHDEDIPAAVRHLLLASRERCGAEVRDCLDAVKAVTGA